MTSWTFGPGGIYTATWDGIGTVTVTLTATGAFLSSFSGQSLAGQDQMPPQFTQPPVTAPAATPSLAASTGTAGYTLVNGTGNVLTWASPADGAMHSVLLIANIDVTSTETGGAIGLNLTSPNNANHTPAVFTGGLSTNYAYATDSFLVAPNTVTALQQTTALSGGAAVLWAELWAL